MPEDPKSEPKPTPSPKIPPRPAPTTRPEPDPSIRQGELPRTDRDRSRPAIKKP